MDFLPIFTNKCHLVCFDGGKCVSKIKEDIKSIHVRLIALICDHFEVFYRQKTDQKGTKIGQFFFQKLQIEVLEIYFGYFFDKYCFRTLQAFI